MCARCIMKSCAAEAASGSPWAVQCWRAEQPGRCHCLRALVCPAQCSYSWPLLDPSTIQNYLKESEEIHP